VIRPAARGCGRARVGAGRLAADAAERAADGTEPSADLNASAEYRAHVARMLVRRALEAV
jgi:carbon-monoxide dehydrogenase medium subunit